jgi:hypothetical protein
LPESYIERRTTRIFPTDEERTNDNGAGSAFDNSRKRLRKLVVAATFHDNELPAERTGRRN